MKEKLTVGQKLWFVPSRSYNGDPRYIEVKRVGREYAYCSNVDSDWESIKLRMSSMYAEDRGYCYLTEQKWSDSVELREAWQELYQKIDRQWSAPKGLTLEQIKEIRVILGYDPKPVAERPTRDERAS